MKKDNVHHPAHYTSGKIECIDIIEEVTKNYSGLDAVCVGNCVKYLYRSHDKGGREDLEKAQWYLNRLIGPAKKRECLKPCKPARTYDGQLDWCFSEVEELFKAYLNYERRPNSKKRAEVLFEALDVITCVKTFIRKMGFTADEIQAGIKYVNAKNEVRGYLDESGKENETP